MNAPHLRQASFIPPASLPGRRSTAGVTRLIPVHGLATHTIESTKTKIRAIETQVVPRHLTQMKAARRQPEIVAVSMLMEAQRTIQASQQRVAVAMQAEMEAKAMRAQEQAAQTHTSQNSAFADAWLKLDEQKAMTIDDPNFIDLLNGSDTSSEITHKPPPGPKPTSAGCQLPQPSIQMHAGGSFINHVGGMRGYQPRRNGYQQEPQKQRAKELSVVPTISKDHTAGEQALRANLLAKLGQGRKRLLSTRHTGRDPMPKRPVYADSSRVLPSADDAVSPVTPTERPRKRCHECEKTFTASGHASQRCRDRIAAKAVQCTF